MWCPSRISRWTQCAQRGNLMAHGPNLRTSYRRFATGVDQIVKGAKLDDLPVELPATLELGVNRKSAEARGPKIPQSSLLLAHRVTESAEDTVTFCAAPAVLKQRR